MCVSKLAVLEDSCTFPFPTCKHAFGAVKALLLQLLISPGSTGILALLELP